MRHLSDPEELKGEGKGAVLQRSQKKGIWARKKGVKIRGSGITTKQVGAFYLFRPEEGLNRPIFRIDEKGGTDGMFGVTV